MNENTTPFKYRAFISYSHRDERWAAWLHKSLERYRVPRRLVGRATPMGAVPARIAPVFRDREELPTATDLSRVVLEVALPFTSKEGVQLTRDGDELCLHVDGLRRTIVLPRALVDAPTTSAKMEDGVLRIQFGGRPPVPAGK